VRLDVKPNILVIMGDDVGWFNIGAYHRGIMSGKTPNLDKLAAEGMLFTDYYAEASCTAGRANFITGELPLGTGLTTVGQAGGARILALCRRTTDGSGVGENGYRLSANAGTSHFQSGLGEEGNRGKDQGARGRLTDTSVAVGGRKGPPALLEVLLLSDNDAGKPESIHPMIGRCPVAAFGNSTGDQQMLEYTKAGGGARLSMLVLHDDAERPWHGRGQMAEFSGSLGNFSR
jgi:Sulfatase